jgi:predicted nucleic acid-binding protein
MTAKFFVDTNVLIYAASNAADDQDKRAIARQVLAEPDLGFSAQVPQEFYSAATTKRRLLMTHDEAVGVLNALATYPVWPVSRDLVLAAINFKQRFLISYWDGAILAAAQALGCHTVYSEDLSDGQVYDGVRVINPFAMPAPMR